MKERDVVLLEIEMTVLNEQLLERVSLVSRIFLPVIKIVLGDAFLVVLETPVGVRQQLVRLLDFHELAVGGGIPRLVGVPARDKI